MSCLLFIVSSLAFVTVVSAYCSPPQWIESSGMKVASSVANAAGNADVSTCQNLCLTRLNCVAIDYTTAGICLLTSDASEALVVDANTNHYEAQRTCTLDGITCVYKSIGQYQWAGQIATTTGASTLDDCVAGCTNSSCTGFAWNPFGDFTCIRTSEAVDSKTDAAIYLAMAKTDCSGGCQPYTWTKEAGKLSASNTATRTSAGDESAFACQLQCLARDDCVSIDYKTSDSTCYVQTDENAALSDETGTDHYTANQNCYEPPSVTCSPPQWIKSAGMKIVASVADATGDGAVAACQGVCLSKLSCTGIDFNTNNNACFLSMNTNGPMVADASIDHYSAQRTCISGKIQCVYERVGAYEFTGQIYTTPGSSTIDECVAGCTGSSCTAFAWEPFGDFNCIKTSEPVGNKADSQLYAMFQKTYCTGDCEPYTWTSAANKVSAGGMRTELGDESAFACQLQCLAMGGCKSVDYNEAGECYTQTNKYAALSDVTGTTHYTARQKCDMPTGSQKDGGEQNLIPWALFGMTWTIILVLIFIIIVGYKHLEAQIRKGRDVIQDTSTTKVYEKLDTQPPVYENNATTGPYYYVISPP